MLQKAIETAVRLHVGQFRDGDDPLPYCTHPVEVVINLRYIGGITDADMLCAAALHDTVEETDATFGDIEKEFNLRVRELVQEVTREEPTKEQTDGMDKDQIWRLRSEMLLEEIGKMTPEAQTIKLADRLANVSEALYTKKGKKLDRYLKQTHEILKILPKSTNPMLWQAIKDMM